MCDNTENFIHSLRKGRGARVENKDKIRDVHVYKNNDTDIYHILLGEQHIQLNEKEWGNLVTTIRMMQKTLRKQWVEGLKNDLYDRVWGDM